MENKTVNASKSSNDSALMVIPTKNDVPCDNSDDTVGLENPNNVRNLKDILKFTTQMTNPSNENENNDLKFTNEKKTFLTNVLSTMTVNVQEEINNSINILLDSKKHLEEHEFALDVISEYIDNIDYAIDFQKLGGFQVIIPGLTSEHKTLRCKTSELISTVVQHNSYCQDKFMEEPKFIDLLIDLVKNDVIDEVRIKSLHAISSLVRHNVSVFWKFINVGGINVIVSSLKSKNEKLMIKSAFLIYSTCHMGNDIVDMYVDNGLVEIICSIIMNMQSSLDFCHHELFLSNLNQFFRMSPIKVKEICTTVEDLKPSLLKLRDSYPNEINYQDEKDQILWLMETLP